MTNPYISWAVVLVVAGGLGYYYNGPKPKERVPAKPSAEKVEQAPAPKKQKKKAKKSPEPSVAPTPKAVESPVVKPTQETEKPDEEIDNNEMAKRFAAVKSGTPLSADSGKSQKSKKKKSAAAHLEGANSDRSGSRVSTRTPSSTGADADDDLSSTDSPVVNASVPAAGYVSDMLEAPAPGASVLRVTGSMESEKKKQKPQSFKQVETKKQRQQRMKNEARKAQVQEAEEQRRKLLEKQLHSARESERRETARSKPAAPATNPWATKDTATTNTNGIQKAQAPKVDLLDTFEPSAQPGASKKWSQGLPSEDEQMRMLGADAQDEWTTVSSKKIKKKGGKADDSVSEASASEVQPTPSPAPAQPKVTVTPTYIPDVLRSTGKGHPLDSDWAA